MDASRVGVGTATGGTLVCQNTQDWHVGSGRRVERHFLLQHCGGAGTVYLDGGTTVSTTTGYPFISTAGAVSVTLDPGEAVYAVAGTVFTDGTIAVLAEGN